MTTTVANSINTLNSAKLSDGRGRTPFAGPSFATINALQGSGAPAASGLEALNSAAGIDPQQLLSDLGNLGAAPKLAAALAGVRRSMADQQAEQAAAAKEDGQQQELKEHARKLVSQTFFGTMLKQMRNSPFKSELFEGGRGGQVFTSMFDQHLSEQMAGGAGEKLVNALVRRLQRIRTQANGGHELNARTEIPKAANPYENVRQHVPTAQ